MPMNDDVIYKPVPGYPELLAGDDGSIWSCWTRSGPRGSNSVCGGIYRRRFGTSNGNGYLRIGLRGKTVYIHDLILAAFVGPCPQGMEACHFPDQNRSNNRPENLRWDTKKNNHADRIKHGTNLPGEENPSAKLSGEDVQFIRRKKGVLLQTLAKKFGVSRSTISAIQLGKVWKHLPQNRKGEPCVLVSPTPETIPTTTIPI